VPARMKAIVGPMFSGKTEEVIRQIKREQYAQRSVHIIKPHVDTRTEAFIASRKIDRDGTAQIVEQYPATVIHNIEELRRELWRGNAEFRIPGPLYKTLAIDEAQFFGLELPELLTKLMAEQAHSDFTVIVAGLDLTWALQPFGCMPQLLAMADEVTKLDAICMKCRKPGGRFTMRIRGTNADVQVGDTGDYEVRCRTCHEIPKFPDTPTAS
jgi:thymidine kinase